MHKRIAVVEDDPELQEVLAAELEMHDTFEVQTTATGRDAIRLASEERCDLMLLDVGLPDMDGREACKILRRQGFRSPVIMLTAQTSDADTILGLEAGANDYMTKPFRFPVLLARIRAQLRQHARSDDAAFTIGPYLFKPGRRMLVADNGAKVYLTDKEAEILKYLYRAAGHAIGRDELLAKVWGYRAGVTTHTVETHIYRLRQKIEPDRARPRLLVRDGGGYRLVPEPDRTDKSEQGTRRQPTVLAQPA